jgi:Peptidase family S41
MNKIKMASKGGTVSYCPFFTVTGRQLQSLLLILFLTFVVTTSSFAKPRMDTLPEIAPELLKQDFTMLRDTLQKIHAGLYTYKSKAAMDHIFDSCFATIRNSMTVTDFYALTRFVIAQIEDGHTNCMLPKQVMDDYVSNTKVFPAMVMFIHNKAFIFCCKQNDGLTESELLSVNGRPMNEIIQRLFGYIQSDGSIQSRKNWEMPENFPLLYNIVYGVKNSFNVVYKTKTGAIKKTTLQPDFIKNIFCSNPFPRPTKYLDLTYKPGNIAVLTLKTFFDGFLKQTNENFSKFLDSSFKDIKYKQIEKLVIDMRSNQGGNDGNGEILYSYLTPKQFRYYASQETVTKKLAESENPNLGLQEPNENNYKGKVYFLINGRSFSGVSEFSSIAKSNNRGIFIGEECGGGYYGNTSGGEEMVTLLNTQIIVRIPLIKYIMAVKKVRFKDRGVIPDYPVYQTVRDIVEHTDGQMTYTLKLIEKN